MIYKYLFLFLFSILLLMPLIFAVITVDSHGVAYTKNDPAATWSRGMGIRALNSVTLTTVQINATSTATNVTIFNGSRDTVASAIVVNRNATFNLALTAGNVYYITAGNNTAAHTGVYRDAGVSFPYTNTNIEWVTGYNGGEDGSNDTLSIYQIDSITTDDLATAIKNITVGFINPTNNTKTINSSIVFSINVTSVDFNITNATIVIYNSTGNIINRTTNSVTGFNITNTSTFSISLITGTYKWNVLGCGINTTITICNYGGSNQTIVKSEIIENSQTFNATVSEGTGQTFIINITYNSTIYTTINATLNYNGSRFTGTQSGSGNNILFTTTINVPTILVQTNYSFNWSIYYSDGLTTTNFNSTTKNQTVNNFGIDGCSAFSVLLLNYTLKDEETQEVINGTLYNSTVQVDVSIKPIGSSIAISNFSGNFTKNNNPQVCLQSQLGDTSYELYVITRYDADGYAAEFNNIYNATLTNSSLPRNIDLFDLLDTDSTEFLITFKNDFFSPVENALINIQRKYISEGTFKTVEIPKTDANGQAVGHFDRDNVLYSITVTKDREVLAIFDNVAIVCQDAIIGDCDINLNALSTIVPLPSIENTGNVSLVYSFNNNTRIISVLFVSTDGLSRTMLLNATLYDTFGNNSLCFSQVVSSAGTVSCTIPASYGNVTFVAKIYADGDFISQQVYTFPYNAANAIGKSEIGAYLFVLLITLPLMFVGNAIGVIIGLILGMIIAAGLLIFTSSSLIGTGAAFFWFIVAAMIVIYKIAKRDT